jgi:hypothetical protein
MNSGHDTESRIGGWEDTLGTAEDKVSETTRKPLAIALSGVERRLTGRGDGGDVTNVQHKSTWNCHNEIPLYHEYILIKKVHDSQWYC